MQISFDAPTWAGLVYQVQMFLLESKSGVTPGAAPVDKVEKVKKSKPAEEVKTATLATAVGQAEGAAAPAPAPAPTQAPAPTPAPAPSTLKPAAEVFMALADGLTKVVLKRGKPVAIALLAEFGVKRAGELKESQYAAFSQRTEAVLAGDTGIVI